MVSLITASDILLTTPVSLKYEHANYHTNTYKKKELHEKKEVVFFFDRKR